MKDDSKMARLSSNMRRRIAECSRQSDHTSADFALIESGEAED
jgi:hypothetical protein